MNLVQAIHSCPHLLSPAALAITDTNGRYQLPAWIAVLNRKLASVPFTPNTRLMVNAPFQHGKLIDDNCPVLTPYGWKKHGDLKKGDTVFAPDGSRVVVEKVGEPDWADYEVETTDGKIVKCHGKHEWYVYDRGAKKWRVLETEFMFSRAMKYAHKCGKRYIFQLPRIAPLQCCEQNLPLDPYVLGAWLGDGKSDGPTVCHDGDEWEVINEIKARGYRASSAWLQEDTGVRYAYFEGLRGHLKNANLVENKHIPEVYFTAPESQRMDLLAGLIDTDGNYSKGSGQYRFSNTNKKLAEQVATLACTLGFKPGKLQEYEACTSSSGIVGKKTTYVVAFSATRKIPCKIPRKQAQKTCEPCRLAIADIRRCEPVRGRCIQVQGGLYLVGENLATTHNSYLSSHYFPAWYLLLFPETRIILVAHSDRFAMSFGSKVKDVIDRFGGPLGIRLRKDSKAKDEWVIDGHGGGMVCRGWGGAVVGRPADLLLLDDLIKDAEEALSPIILEKQFDWYSTVAYSRLGPTAGIVLVGTRWGTRDIFGRILNEARDTNEKWEHIKFKAIATTNDPLGRKPGEALWPERQPLSRLKIVQQKRGKWFGICWQQEPQDEAGGHFNPAAWPVYDDMGDAYSIEEAQRRRTIVRKEEVQVFITIDWATSEKETSDYTAVGVFGLLPDGRLLILDVLNQRFRLEHAVPHGVAPLCRRWRPRWGAAEAVAFQATLANECRRYPEIPELRKLQRESRPNAKLRRALPAIIMGENRRIYMPSRGTQAFHSSARTPWVDDFVNQLSLFTGVDDEHDDMVDIVSDAAQLAQAIRPAVFSAADYSGGPVMLGDGYQPF